MCDAVSFSWGDLERCSSFIAPARNPLCDYSYFYCVGTHCVIIITSDMCGSPLCDCNYFWYVWEPIVWLYLLLMCVGSFFSFPILPGQQTVGPTLCYFQLPKDFKPAHTASEFYCLCPTRLGLWSAAAGSWGSWSFSGLFQFAPPSTFNAISEFIFSLNLHFIFWFVKTNGVQAVKRT